MLLSIPRIPYGFVNSRSTFGSWIARSTTGARFSLVWHLPNPVSFFSLPTAFLRSLLSAFHHPFDLALILIFFAML